MNSFHRTALLFNVLFVASACGGTALRGSHADAAADSAAKGEGLAQREGSEAMELAKVALVLAAMPAVVEVTAVGPPTVGPQVVGTPVEWMAASMRTLGRTVAPGKAMPAQTESPRGRTPRKMQWTLRRTLRRIPAKCWE